MEVAVFVSDLVQVEQGLVDGLLQFKSRLHGLLAAAPLIFGRFLDILQHNAAAAVVLELHESLGVLQLLVSGLPEILGKVRESHIFTIEVERLGGKGINRELSKATHEHITIDK